MSQTSNQSHTHIHTNISDSDQSVIHIVPHWCHKHQTKATHTATQTSVIVITDTHCITLVPHTDTNIKPKLHTQPHKHQCQWSPTHTVSRWCHTHKHQTKATHILAYLIINTHAIHTTHQHIDVFHKRKHKTIPKSHNFQIYIIYFSYCAIHETLPAWYQLSTNPTRSFKATKWFGPTGVGGGGVHICTVTQHRPLSQFHAALGQQSWAQQWWWVHVVGEGPTWISILDCKIWTGKSSCASTTLTSCSMKGKASPFVRLEKLARHLPDQI